MFGTKQETKWDVMGETKVGFSIITTNGKRTFRLEVTKPNGDIEIVSDTDFGLAMADMAEAVKDVLGDLWFDLLDKEFAEADLDDESNDEASLAFQSLLGDPIQALNNLTVRPTSPIEAL